MTSIKAHYWDASALVRLVAEDPVEQGGRADLRTFFFGQGHHYSTSACLAEALGVFKRKWLDKIYTLPEYVRTVREFYRLVEGMQARYERSRIACDRVVKLVLGP
jgi:hypothetical protein